MTDQEKAQRLLDQASRVLTWPESLLCDAIRRGSSITDDQRHQFAVLCNRLEHYLR